MSLGMMMMPPVIISTPCKLLLFVLVEGWQLLAQAIVGSFGFLMIESGMANDTLAKNTNLGFAQRSETWLSLCFLLTLVVLIVPLYTFLLDMFLAMKPGRKPLCCCWLR